MTCNVRIRVNGQLKQALSQSHENPQSGAQPSIEQAPNHNTSNAFVAINHSIKLAQQQTEQINQALGVFNHQPEADHTRQDLSIHLQQQLQSLITLCEFDCGSNNLPPLAKHIEAIIFNSQLSNEGKKQQLEKIDALLFKCLDCCNLAVIGENDIIVKRTFSADKHKRTEDYKVIIEQLQQHCRQAIQVLTCNNEQQLAGHCQLQLRDYHRICQGESKISEHRSNLASGLREAARSASDDLNALNVNWFGQNGPQNGAIAGGLADGIQLGSIYFARKQGKLADFKNKLAKNLLILSYQQLITDRPRKKYQDLGQAILRALQFRRGNNFKNSWLFKKMLAETDSVTKMRNLLKQPEILTQAISPKASAISNTRSEEANPASLALHLPELNFAQASGQQALALLAPELRQIRALLKQPASNFALTKKNICQQIEQKVHIPSAAAQSSEKIFFILLDFCLTEGKYKIRSRKPGSLRQQYSTVLTRLFQTEAGRTQLAVYFSYNPPSAEKDKQAIDYPQLQTAATSSQFERLALKLLASSNKSTYTNNLMLVMVALEKNEQLAPQQKTAIKNYLYTREINPNFGYLFTITNQHQANYLKNGITTFIRYGFHNTPTMQHSLGLPGQLSPTQTLALQGARWGEWQLNLAANSSSHHLLPRTHTANTALSILELARNINFSNQHNAAQSGILQPEQARISNMNANVRSNDDSDEAIEPNRDKARERGYSASSNDDLTREIAPADAYYENYAKISKQNGKWLPQIYHRINQPDTDLLTELNEFLANHPHKDFKINAVQYHPQASLEEFMLFAAQLPWSSDEALLSLIFLQAIIMQPGTAYPREKQEILELILAGGLKDANSVTHHLTKHSANKSLAYGLISGTFGAAVYALSIALVPLKGIGLVGVKLAGNTARLNLSNGELIQRGVNLVPAARPNRYQAPRALFARCRKLLTKPPAQRNNSSLIDESIEQAKDAPKPLLQPADQENVQPQDNTTPNYFSELLVALKNPQLTNNQRLQQLWEVFERFGNQQLDRRLAQQLLEKIVTNPLLQPNSKLWQCFGEKAEAAKARSLFFANLILALKNKSLFAILRSNRFASKLNTNIAALTTLAPSMFTDLGIADTFGLKGLTIDAFGGAVGGINNLQAQSKYQRTNSYCQIIGYCKQELNKSKEAAGFEPDSTEYKIIKQALQVKRFKFLTRLKHPLHALKGALTTRG